MNPAISEWTWTMFVLLLRTGIITTVILLAALVVIRCQRGASAAASPRPSAERTIGKWTMMAWRV